MYRIASARDVSGSAGPLIEECGETIDSAGARLVEVLARELEIQGEFHVFTTSMDVSIKGVPSALSSIRSSLARWYKVIPANPSGAYTYRFNQGALLAYQGADLPSGAADISRSTILMDASGLPLYSLEDNKILRNVALAGVPGSELFSGELPSDVSKPQGLSLLGSPASVPLVFNAQLSFPGYPPGGSNAGRPIPAFFVFTLAARDQRPVRNIYVGDLNRYAARVSSAANDGITCVPSGIRFSIWVAEPVTQVYLFLSEAEGVHAAGEPDLISGVYGAYALATSAVTDPPGGGGTGIGSNALPAPVTGIW